MHRAVLLAQGPEIDEAAVELAPQPGAAQPAFPQPGAGAGQPASSGGGISSLVGLTMDQVERDLILQTLSHTLGNRTHAATILGISIRALRNKLRDYSQQGLSVTPPAAGVAA